MRGDHRAQARRRVHREGRLRPGTALPRQGGDHSHPQVISQFYVIGLTIQRITRYGKPQQQRIHKYAAKLSIQFTLEWTSSPLTHWKYITSAASRLFSVIIILAIFPS